MGGIPSKMFKKFFIVVFLDCQVASKRGLVDFSNYMLLE